MTDRTFVIRRYDGKYFYITRMPAGGKGPEECPEYECAIKFTYEEALEAMKSLFQFCDTDAVYGMEYFRHLAIHDSGIADICSNGNTKAFFEWANRRHPDALNDMFKEYLASQKEPTSEDGTPHPNGTNTPMSTDTPSTYEEHRALQESRRLMTGDTMEPSKSPSYTPHDYEKENDLAVYVHCVERMDQVTTIMNVYPKNMTLEQVYESVKYQLEKFKRLVIGTT